MGTSATLSLRVRIFDRICYYVLRSQMVLTEMYLVKEKKNSCTQIEKFEEYMYFKYNYPYPITYVNDIYY